jgi:hypothetical protein
MRILRTSQILLLIFTFGCAPTQAEDLAPSEPQSRPVEETSAPAVSDPSFQGDSTEMTPTMPAPAGLENLIERAKEDLAQRLNIVLTQINLIEAKAVVWPDASLGCPQPGKLYKQVPEDGALIVLQVNGTNYEYHNGGSRGLFLCERTYKNPLTPPKIELKDLTPFLQDKNNPTPPTPDRNIPPGEDQ